MELINHTNYPTELYRTVIDESRFAAAIIVRVTYNLTNGSATPSTEQVWPVKMAPWENEFGSMPSDAVFYRGGIDLFVFGNAHTKDDKLLKQMELKIFVDNSLINCIRVYGHRIWEKGFFGFRASDPEPFTSIPISLENAYGGTVDWDGLKFPFGNNPIGKGFICKKENTVGTQLPNFEYPENLITKWDDRPDPVGTGYCPMNELHTRGNIEYDQYGEITKIHPRLYNNAFPAMILKGIDVGSRVRLLGFTSDNYFEFVVPQHNLKAQVCLGEKKIERTLAIDQICLIPEKQQAFITYRYPFRYVFHVMQKRHCEIWEDLNF